MPATKTRGLWRVGGSLLTVGLLFLGLIQTVAQLAHEQYTEVETFDADGIAVVEVRSGAGGVQVIGSGEETDTITVTAHVGDGLERTRQSRRVDGDRLVLDGRCPGFFSNFCRIAYTVELPSHLDVVVRSEDRVTVADVDGAVDIRAGARIEVERLNGPVRLDSRYSRVRGTELGSRRVDAVADGRLELGFDRPPETVDARSRYSRLEISLPDDGDAYDVDAHSSYGSVVSATMRTDPDSPRRIRARADSDVVLRLE